MTVKNVDLVRHKGNIGGFGEKLKVFCKVLVAKVVDAILPPRCVSCGLVVEGKQGLCAICWADVQFITDPICETTGVPLEVDSYVTDLTLVQPDLNPLYRKARSAFVYNKNSKRIVLRFKHADQTYYVDSLAEMMIRTGDKLLEEADIICPVPLHWQRLMRRKYNQSALLANAMAKMVDVIAIPDLLVRTRPTPTQGSLRRAERAKNVRGAFSLNSKFDPYIQGKTVVLIDDVMTTGATVEECVKVLLDYGVKHVDVLTLARVL